MITRHKIEFVILILSFVVASYILITTTKEYQFSNTAFVIITINLIFQLDRFFTATDENGAPIDKKLDRKIKILLFILTSIYLAIAYFTNSSYILNRL